MIRGLTVTRDTKSLDSGMVSRSGLLELSLDADDKTY
jgi:hypothetical protein